MVLQDEWRGVNPRDDDSESPDYPDGPRGWSQDVFVLLCHFTDLLATECGVITQKGKHDVEYVGEEVNRLQRIWHDALRCGLSSLVVSFVLIRHFSLDSLDRQKKRETSSKRHEAREMKLAREMEHRNNRGHGQASDISACYPAVAERGACVCHAQGCHSRSPYLKV